VSLHLITGVSGQDGAYLAAQLLARGEHVLGTRRAGAQAGTLWRLRALGIEGHARLQLLQIDLADAAACRELLSARPYALYHLAAQSRVAESLRDPQASLLANGLVTRNLLEALHASSPQTRFVFASSAELFGHAREVPQSEATPFAPANPYAQAKHYAHRLTQQYRSEQGVHASCAILFNHESPLRAPDFVTRKIAAAAVRLSRGSDSTPLALGNLAAQRDFGYAPEYVAAMAAMAERAHGDDYVLATGVATSIRRFAELAFAAAGIALQWQGEGAAEHALDAAGRTLLQVDPALFRPHDAPLLVGDARRARAELGFAPRTDVAALARLMVEAERQR